MVWYDDTPGNFDIFYSTKPSGGSWSTSVNISDNSGGSGFPGLAMDSSGGLHVVWYDDTPGNFDIFYSTKPSGGSWSGPVDVSNNSGNSKYPAIVIDGSSKVHSVWVDNSLGSSEILYATDEAAAGGGLPVWLWPAVGSAGGLVAGIIVWRLARWRKSLGTC